VKYKIIVPPTMEQGSYTAVTQNSYTKTFKQNALWDYNNAREHDNFCLLKRMPNGTQYIKVENEK